MTLGAARVLALLLAVGACAVSCGRSELDWVGPVDEPASTGGAGTTGTAGTTGRGTAGTTGAAGRGAAGTTGAAGTRGAPPAPIPCGATSCTAGAQKCCVDVMVGPMGGKCVPAAQSCGTSASIACFDPTSCGGGVNVCCVGTSAPPSTSCENVAACLTKPGLIICNSDADCPAVVRNCCGVPGLKLCGPQPCSSGPIP
jgi:hypothetical protein